MCEISQACLFTPENCPVGCTEEGEYQYDIEEIIEESEDDE